jgi:hypothetical protein
MGPIDASGRGVMTVSAHLTYGIDGQGLLDRVTVHRDAAPPDQAVTVELTGTGGRPPAVGRARIRREMWPRV